MRNHYLTKLVIVVFVIGTGLLIIIQYNYSQSMHNLIKGNAALVADVKEANHLREVERDIVWFESKIRAAIATDDTSHLEGMTERSPEIDRYLDTLKKTTKNQEVATAIDRLRAIAQEKISIRNKLLESFKRTGRMDFKALIANPGARKKSDEITFLTKKVFLSRQSEMEALSDANAVNARAARLYGYILSALIVLSGAGVCWFIIVRINTQNRLIVELDASEKRAREAALIKENFMANMSHEIRTPLNSILGFTNLLMKRELASEPKEFVHSIQQASENLLAIINDILDLSKIEAGMMRIVNKPFSVNGLLQSIQTLFLEKMKGKGLSFKTSINPDIPDTVIGDATRLTQILVNLIGNALKFSDKGIIEVNVFSNAIMDKTIELGFTIADNGIGIEKEKLSQIFERFNQGEDFITRTYGGTGLGLSIVKDLIEIQKGKIMVESELGKGTRFTFYIPYTIADEQIRAEQKNDEEIKYELHNQLINILVVDDNQMNQSLMRHLLNQWDIKFDIASNGKEALKELQERSYDLVLMDIQMPEMNGYSAAQLIRSELKLDVPIIAMTAHAMPGEREKCISFGMNEYISKPIIEKDLFDLISKFVKPDKHPEKSIDAAINVGHFEYINLHYMKSISNGNLEYEKIVTGQFIEIIPKHLLEIKEAYADHDNEVLGQIAHDMKTSVAIMGLLPILEDRLDSVEYSVAFDHQLDENIEVITKVCLSAVKEAEQFYNSF